MNTSRILTFLLLATTGCGCGGASIDRGVTPWTGAITDGELDPGHRAVGWLSMQGAYSLCTATLIGERTVLTAAHCITDLQVAKFFVADRAYGVAGWQGHPAFARPFVNDVAVVTLAEPVAGVAPIRLSRARPAVGQEVTLVGYGVTDAAADDEGVRRVANNRIAQLTDNKLAIEGSGGDRGNSCAGDSGGPLLATDGSQVGIASHGAAGLDKGTCGTEGWYTRVDVFVDWIQRVAEEELQPQRMPPELAPPAPQVPSTPAPAPAIEPPPPPQGAGCALGERPGHDGGAVSWFLLLLAVAVSRRATLGA